ncbi:DUF5995 family protein [Pedobacter sp. Leaf194]|uniref:DUF5995 family protein n=1 Tax=Pedobacter sp. Leaf194 TaxID=1736297 RepID=UPI0007036C9A|nr:DUF5995 family protein [Pedobacter sp. Leaf194]KQS32386.1 hypothetical protein ASG14_15970 [Pedobacter sp. Leaf194]
MQPANTIIEVISRLDDIIIDSIKVKSRNGYFACLYRKMTIAVQKGINDGLFKDGQRMEKLDVIFANRYIDAYHCQSQRKPLSSSWNAAFSAAFQPYTVIQHLLLGMNAHINLDLGVAAAETSKAGDIQLLKQDFNLINDIIASLINIVQKDLEEICLPMKMLKYVDNKSKESVINFSITAARDAAWANAVGLSKVLPGMYIPYINALDSKIALVANGIKNPNFSQSFTLRTVRTFEPKDVGDIIKFLKD